MKIPAVASITNLREVAPGSWCVFPSSHGRHLGMVVKGNPGGPGTTIGCLDLVCFAPEPSLRARLWHAEREWVGAPDVLELAGIELDVPIDLTHVYLDATRAEVNDLWKPGALVITPEGFHVVATDKDDDLCMVNLTDASLNWKPREKASALVTQWRLVQRFDEHVREVYAVKVER